MRGLPVYTMICEAFSPGIIIAFHTGVKPNEARKSDHNLQSGFGQESIPPKKSAENDPLAQSARRNSEYCGDLRPRHRREPGAGGRP